MHHAEDERESRLQKNIFAPFGLPPATTDGYQIMDVTFGVAVRALSL